MAVRKVITFVRLGTEGLEDLLLEAEIDEALLQRGTRVGERLLGATEGRRRDVLLGNRRKVLVARLVQTLLDVLDLLAETGDELHVLVALFIELVGDDAVESLALALELVEEGGVHRRREQEAVEHVAGLDLGIFNRLADRDLLLTREQLDLTHLVQVHADRIFDHLRRARLRISRLLVLRLDPLPHVLLTKDLDTQGFQDLEVTIGLDGVDDVLRKNLIKLFVGDIATVRLAAALDIVNDIVQLGLAKNRHAFHRRKHRLDIGNRVVVLAEARHRRRLQGGVALLFGMRALTLLDLGHELVGIEGRSFNLGIFVRRKIVVPVIGLAATAARRLDRNVPILKRCGQLLVLVNLGHVVGLFLDNLLRLATGLLAGLRTCWLLRLLRRLHGLRLLLRFLLSGLLQRFFDLCHISPVYNSPNDTLSSVCILYHILGHFVALKRFFLRLLSSPPLFSQARGRPKSGERPSRP